MKSLCSFLNVIVLICSSAVITPWLHTPASAQQTCGGIEGRVTTPEGWVIPGAKVELLNKETKQSTNVATEDKGEYSACLSAGLYDVTVTSPGFKTAKRKAIRVENAIRSIIDFPMKRGAAKPSH